MDTNYAAKLAISILIFAPGLVMLAIALFVGILASLEKTGVLRLAQRRLEKTPEPVPATHEA